MHTTTVIPRTQAEQHTQQVRQSERSARYEHIIALSKQGMKSSDIAVHVGMRSAYRSTLARLPGVSRIPIRDANGLVSLIPTKPIFSSAGTRDATTSSNWKKM